MKFMKLVPLALFAIMFSGIASAHGESKPGPHGGYVKMPGAFHTEVVPDQAQTFKVYLLDIAFKTLKVTGAVVKAQIKVGSILTTVLCNESQDFFECKAPGQSILDLGTLLIDATTPGLPGAPIQYKLPLSFADPMN